MRTFLRNDLRDRLDNLQGALWNIDRKNMNSMERHLCNRLRRVLYLPR